MAKSSPNSPDTFPFLVIGNKCDLEDQRKVSIIEGKKFAQQNGGMLFYESSAKDNVNVETAFKELGAAAIQRQLVSVEKTSAGSYVNPNKMSLDKKKSEPEAKKKGGCCK